MKRKPARPRKEAASISLFPFMDVFLCIMGALILMFIVIARTSRDRVDEKTRVAEAEATVVKEDLDWKIDNLRGSRDKTAADLADARLELGHLEDHASRLRDQIAELQRAAIELDRTASAADPEKEKLRARLHDLEEQLKLARAALDKARKTTQDKQDSYAILPYDGPNQTRRRPIYIECRADAVIIQPEGVEFNADDLNGASGPANPLAACLRSAREYIAETSGPEAANEGRQPYPLLLVRPDGIPAYYAARQAMSSWGSEFGYEFIDSDWTLAFPQSDPGMAVVLSKAQDDARQRQVALAMAAPGLLTPQERATYRAIAAERAAHGGRSRGSRGKGHGFGDGSDDGDSSGNGGGPGGHGGRSGSQYGARPPGAGETPGGGAPYAAYLEASRSGPGGAGDGGTGTGNGTGADGGRYAGGSPGYGGSGAGGGYGNGYGSGTGGAPDGYLAGGPGGVGNGPSGSGPGAPGGYGPGGTEGVGPGGPGSGGLGPGGVGPGGLAAPGSGTGATGPGNGGAGGTGGYPNTSSFAAGNGMTGATGGSGIPGGGTGGNDRVFGPQISLAGNGSNSGGTGSGNGGGGGAAGGPNSLASGGGNAGVETPGAYGAGGVAGAPGATGPGFSGIPGAAGARGSGGVPGSGSMPAAEGSLAGTNMTGAPGTTNNPYLAASGNGGAGSSSGAGGQGASGGAAGPGGTGGPAGTPGSANGAYPGEADTASIWGDRSANPVDGAASGGRGGAASSATGASGGNGTGTTAAGALAANGAAGGQSAAGGSNGSGSGNSSGNGSGGANGQSSPGQAGAQSGGMPPLQVGNFQLGAAGQPGTQNYRIGDEDSQPSSSSGRRASGAQADMMAGPAGPQLKPFETAGKSYAKPSNRLFSPPAHDESDDGPDSDRQKKSLANSRGKNWGLPNSSKSAIFITRPIYVECYSDRLVVLSESGDRKTSKTIEISGETSNSVDELVTGIWDRINSWGPAGRGMFWRPTLVVSVAPDGGGRYEDLHDLLSDSGLGVQTKTETPAPTGTARRLSQRK